MILKNCKYIITQDIKRRILKDYDIKIEGNRIVRIAKNIEGRATINCRDRVVMPGLINTHAHLGMHSLKGICDDETLFNWLDIVRKEEEKLTLAQIQKNTEDGAEECIRSGTTTVYDSYKFAPERRDVFERLGMRAFVSSTVTKEKHLKHIEHLMKDCDKSPLQLVRPIIAGHSPYMCTQELLEQIRDISDRYNLMRRIHIAETKKEVDIIKKEKNMTPIEYLDSFGFLSKKALLVHCVWVDDKEIDMIAKKGSSVSHNPISNMKLASGNVTPVVRMIEKGINIGLGTDSVVSNNDLDMFEELKVTALLHKHHNNNPKAMTYQKVLDMATIHGAGCLGFENLGRISKGYLADIITLDMKGLTPVNNLVSNIVYCANGNNVCDSIIDGKIVMRNRELLV